MLNCIYDCRYCFLQGMYNSGNYVLFVNFSDFEEEMKKKLGEIPNEEIYFFSGYDCDSLALEPITHFVESFLPFFKRHPRAFLELRTKSVNIRFLLETEAIHNCIVAFTLTPDPICSSLEHRTPSLFQRLKAIKKLQEKGWKIGLRFDPIIYIDHYEKIYNKFFEDVFDVIDLSHLHSVTLGPFRLPKAIFKNMANLYPREKLFAHSLEEQNGLVSYKPDIEKKLLSFCSNLIKKYIPESHLFCYGL